MFTVAIDAMGGDNAPVEIIKGALQAIDRLADVEAILLGPVSRLKDALIEAGHGVGPAAERLKLLDAPECIEMGESPVEALRRKTRSSISLGIGLVASGEAHAFLSAGNTGACVASSFGQLGLLPGVRRPGIAVQFHCERPVVVIDVGANIKCTPEVLYQYGIMASSYARRVLQVEAPRVGLLNVGSEDRKGSRPTQEAFSLLQQSDVNFVGNIEGGDIFKGVCEVVVCDGFVGNVVLKVSEGLAEGVFQIFRQVLGVDDEKRSPGTTRSPKRIDREILERSRTALQAFRERIDYAEQGGAPLLGINGICIICHGRSHAGAIANAIRTGRDMAECRLNEIFVNRLRAESVPCDGGR